MVALRGASSENENGEKQRKNWGWGYIKGYSLGLHLLKFRVTKVGFEGTHGGGV